MARQVIPFRNGLTSAQTHVLAFERESTEVFAVSDEKYDTRISVTS